MIDQEAHSVPVSVSAFFIRYSCIVKPLLSSTVHYTSTLHKYTILQKNISIAHPQDQVFHIICPVVLYL